MIVSYTNKLNKDDYDTIVIGSGMGGMASAGILARQGQRVLVLEKHFIAGGLTHSFKRKKFEWDVGLHYIGNVHNEDHISRQTFDYITESKLRWHKIQGPYDKISLTQNGKKTEIEIGAGRESFVEALVAAFPNERRTIETYLDKVLEVHNAMNNYFAERLLPVWLGKILYPLLSKKFRSFSDQTTLEVLSQLTSNNALIEVLTARYGNYGLPPGKSSFAMHAVVVHTYIDGANYPEGGTSEVAKNVAKVVVKYGGSFVVNADVQTILLKKNKAVGVCMANGDRIYAKRIISNAGYEVTVQKLLPLSKDALQQRKIVQGDNVKVSVGHLTLHVGLEGNAETLGLDQANHWLPPSGDHDKLMDSYLKDYSEEFPFVFISSSSTKDPKWAAKNPHISTVTVIVPASYEWFKQWQAKPWMKRGEVYERLKDHFSKRLIESLYSRFPKTKGKVRWEELSTPLTTVHFCQREKGGMYGYEHSPERFKQKWLRPASPVKGLYMVGQDFVTGGVTAALMSALLATSLILRKNMMTALPKAHLKSLETEKVEL